MTHHTRGGPATHKGQLGWGYGPAPASPAGSDEDIVDETAACTGSVPRTRSGDTFGGGARSSARDPQQPGCAAKLTTKVKNLFCFQQDMHYRMYQAHKREKENRQRQMDFYMH